MRRVLTTISLILAALLFSGVVPVGTGPKSTHSFLPTFEIILTAKALASETEQKVHYPGKLVLNFAGPVLGQVMAHDVLIPDGSLNLTRRDIAPLKGTGPDLKFTRSYSNLQDDDNPYEFMGYGWTHNPDLKLIPLCTEGEAVSGCVPEWVNSRLGMFFKTGDVPTDPERWTSVKVNGTNFIKVGGKWYPSRGRHGRLREEYGGPLPPPPRAVPEFFIYTSKDSTEYKYPYPVREKVPDSLYITVSLLSVRFVICV